MLRHNANKQMASSLSSSSLFLFLPRRYYFNIRFLLSLNLTTNESGFKEIRFFSGAKVLNSLYQKWTTAVSLQISTDWNCMDVCEMHQYWWTLKPSTEKYQYESVASFNWLSTAKPLKVPRASDFKMIRKMIIILNTYFSWDLAQR